MDTRDKLINSTRELLWERGYVGTSPKAIQERSGAGQGSMYHHFRGKPDLAHAAISVNAEEMRARIVRQFSAPGSVFDRIATCLRRERDALKGCPVGGLTHDPDVMADPQLRKPIEDVFEWFTGQMAELLDQGRKEGEFHRNLDPRTTAAALVAVLQGGYVLARASHSVSAYEDAIEGALGLLACHASAPAKKRS